ncbi:MAG TPA: sulfatase, partial [Terriglobales bacterium]
MFRRGFLLLWLAVVTTSWAAGKPNIVLITLDSTRADRMGFLRSDQKLTPALDALSRESMVFEHAYAQAPSTVVSHATILTGTYPQTTQISEAGSLLSASLPYLPDLLRAQKYRTAAFVGSLALDPRNGMAPGFDRGFDHCETGFRGPLAIGQADKRSAAAVVAQAAAWLARNPQRPFFLWLHFADPHAPHGASYDSAVRSSDAAAGKFLGTLRSQGLYDNTLVAVAADHGESLGAHGEDTHGIFLYDETVHVPLLLKLPGNQMAGKRVAAKVRLVDIAPTILEVAGVPVPSQMQGQSLLRIAKSNADQPAYSRSDFPQRAFG